MSETEIGVAVFRSVWPGVARTMRAVSAKVTVVSVPLSNVMTTELPVTDLTVPIALAAGVCEKIWAGKMQAITATKTQSRSNDLISRDGSMCTLINSITCGTKEGVKNCQTWVKVVRTD